MRIVKRYYKMGLKHPYRALLAVKGLLLGPLIKLYVRLRGVKFGRGGIFLGRPFIDRAIGSRIELGDYFTLQSLRYLNRIGLWHAVMLQTEERDSFITIGDYFEASGTTIYASKGVTIGHHVIIGANSVITDSDFHPVSASTRDSVSTGNVGKKEIVIGNNVWIGMNCIILKGVHLGDHSAIAAGSVVTRDIPSHCLAAGVPARVVKSLETCKAEQDVLS